MATLKPEHKVFIVQRLACFDTLTQCSDAFKEEFGFVLPPQQIQAYHPEKHAGRNLSKSYVKLFNDTRESFRKNTEDIPIASKAFRVNMLHRMAVKAEANKNMVLAAAFLEQAAKEMGEAYTNRQKVEHTSPDGSMTPAVAQPDLSNLSIEDLQALASIAEKHSGGNKQS